MKDIELVKKEILENMHVVWFIHFYERFGRDFVEKDDADKVRLLLGLPERTSYKKLHRILKSDFLLTCHLAAKKI